MTKTVLHTLWKRAIDSLSNQLIEHLDEDEQQAFIDESSQLAHKTKLLHPEEDLRKQLNIAHSLEAIWKFLLRRITTGSAPAFAMFSIVDHQSELIRLRAIWPDEDGVTIQGEFIPLCDRENHLVRTTTRTDTTFTANTQELGPELERLFQVLPKVGHIFSVPLVAAGKTVALVTLGFNELDSFTQAKLSSIYVLRDALAQAVYNLILQEQLEAQPPLDALTQLPLANRFNTLLTKELRKAQYENHPLSLVFIDFYQLKKYNLQYSPQMGDQAILKLCNQIKRNTRGIDTLVKVRADQFALILPEIDTEQAQTIANQIIHGIQTPYRAIPDFKVAVSICQAQTNAKTAEELEVLGLQILDYAKYQVSETQTSCIITRDEFNEATDSDRLLALNNKFRKQNNHHEGSELFEVLWQRLYGDREQTSPELSPSGLKLADELEQLLSHTFEKALFLKPQTQAAVTYSVALANALQLNAKEVEKIRLAALLQNVGYSQLPQPLIEKTAKLAADEKLLIEKHPHLASDELLSPYPVLEDILPLIAYHHERYNGSGYPYGLKGENIPLGAQIIGLCDTFCALTSPRPHRKAYTVNEALVILNTQMQGGFEKELLVCFGQIIQLAQKQQHALATDEIDPEFEAWLEALSVERHASNIA